MPSTAPAARSDSRSSLHAPHQQALHVVALQRQEQQQHRQHGHAPSRPSSARCPARARARARPARPAACSRSSSVSTISGHMKSFQLPRKREDRQRHEDRLAAAAARSWQKIRNSPAPSMRAASSSSSGIVRAYWRTRKMPKMLAMRRHDHAGVGVDQAHLLEQQEQRHHRHLRRDHQRRRAAARKMRSRPAKRSLAKA